MPHLHRASPNPTSHLSPLTFSTKCLHASLKLPVPFSPVVFPIHPLSVILTGYLDS
jgi:biotin transporter BioY